MQPFVHFSVLFCLYKMLHNLKSMSSNFLVIHTSSGILSKSAAFLLLIFFQEYIKFFLHKLSKLDV